MSSTFCFALWPRCSSKHFQWVGVPALTDELLQPVNGGPPLNIGFVPGDSVATNLPTYSHHQDKGKKSIQFHSHASCTEKSQSTTPMVSLSPSCNIQSSTLQATVGLGAGAGRVAGRTLLTPLWFSQNWQPLNDLMLPVWTGRKEKWHD